MKKLLFFACLFITSFHSIAQTAQEEHVLDGTTFDIYYENGFSFHIGFEDGRLVASSISGPGNDISREFYRAKKFSDKIYVVNFMKTPDHSFCTLIINFDQNKVMASAIRGVGRSNEAVFLDGAIIEKLHLKEN